MFTGSHPSENTYMNTCKLFCFTERSSSPTNKKHKYKQQQNVSYRRRIFGRGSSRKIAPMDSSSTGTEVVSIKTKLQRTPSYIFDIAIIAPPTELGIEEMTDNENKSIYGWLLNETVTPVSVSDSHKTEADYVSVTQLYNCMSDGQKSCYLFDPLFLLLLDTRPLESYKAGHINTAYHLSDLFEREQDFEPFEEYTLVVLYDEDGLSYSLTNSELSQAMDELIGRKSDAFVLEGGYKEFHMRFPYFCTDKIATSEAERQSLVPNYPSIILENQLYLGRADQASNHITIENLEISHIVSITQDVSKPFEDSINYYHVKLPDEPNVSLHKCFPEAIKFIDEALNNHGKVLVHCNLGQSRSCTLVTAYLMFTKHWNLHDAYGYVKEHRPVVHPNEGFMNQLSNFEKALYGKRLTNIELYGYKLVSLKNSGKKKAKKKDHKVKIKLKKKKDYKEMIPEDDESHNHEGSDQSQKDSDENETSSEDSDGRTSQISSKASERSVEETPSSKHTSESESLQDDEVVQFKTNQTDLQNQKHYKSVPLIDTSNRTEERQVEPEGVLQYVVPASKIATNSDDENKSLDEEQDSLIDVTQAENEVAKGITNVALEVETNATNTGNSANTTKQITTRTEEYVSDFPEVTSL